MYMYKYGSKLNNNKYGIHIGLKMVSGGLHVTWVSLKSYQPPPPPRTGGTLNHYLNKARREHSYAGKLITDFNIIKDLESNHY
jgi:hypothetical protein